MAPDGGACGDGVVGGGAGEAMGGAGGMAVVPVAACAYVLGAECEEP